MRLSAWKDNKKISYGCFSTWRFRLWFDFRVHNNFPGQRVILSIVNFSKTRSLYRHGMTPVYHVLGKSDWSRMFLKDVFYYKSPKHNQNYVLSMVVTMHELGDVHEIAYTFPYTYTRLQHQLAFLESCNYPFVRRELLCRCARNRTQPSPSEQTNNSHPTYFWHMPVPHLQDSSGTEGGCNHHFQPPSQTSLSNTGSPPTSPVLVPHPQPHQVPTRRHPSHLHLLPSPSRRNPRLPRHRRSLRLPHQRRPTGRSAPRTCSLGDRKWPQPHPQTQQ